MQGRARGGDFKGSIVDHLQGVLWWSGRIRGKGWGVLNTEFAEDTESQRRGDEVRMWIGKHGRG